MDETPAAPAAAIPELQVGQAFAGHRIDAVAGRGGMGIVYRATQLDLQRTVALKLIAPALAEDPLFRERFIRETRVAAAIDHPNVIPVFYAGEHERRLYLAMRYVAGEDLRTLVRREGPLDPARAARIVAQIAAALDAAHARGIVHRDVKPANVLLDAGDHAYLTDFGLTRRVQSAAGITQAGGWVGTLGYVAPEQIRGERVDARADVYALGCVAHFALTGDAPHARDSDEATLWAHLYDEPAPLAEHLGEALGPVLARALAKDPAERYPSAGDLGRALLGAAGAEVAEARPERVVATGAAAPTGNEAPVDEPTVSSPAAPSAMTVHVPGATERRPQRTRPSAALAVIAAVSVLLVAGLFALLLSGGDTPKPSTTTAPRLPTVAPARVVGSARTGPSPNDVVATAATVWVSSARDTVLTRVSALTGRASGTAAVGPRIQALAVGFGRLWAARRGSLLRLDRTTGRPAGAPFALPPGLPVAVAVGQGGVWVALRNPDTVVRVDPRTGATTTAPVLDGVQDMAVGEGAVWVVARRARRVYRFDPADLAAAPRRIPVPTGPSGIAVGEGYVWVCIAAANQVTRIDPQTDRKSAFIRTGDTPTGIDVGGGSVWVTDKLGGTVTRIDATPGHPPRPQQTIAGFTNPFAVAARGNDVWVTDIGDSTLRHLRF